MKSPEHFTFKGALLATPYLKVRNACAFAVCEVTRKIPLYERLYLHFSSSLRPYFICTRIRLKINYNLAGPCKDANNEHLPYLRLGNRRYFPASASFVLIGLKKKKRHMDHNQWKPIVSNPKETSPWIPPQTLASRAFNYERSVKRGAKLFLTSFHYNRQTVFFFSQDYS